jgi:hypothetical protein
MKFEANTAMRTASTLIALGVIAAIGGCGEETQTTLPISADPQIEPIPPAPMSSYSGPGSVWNYELHTDGTYSVSRDAGTDSELLVSGSYQSTAAGFLSMTVDSSSGNNAPAPGASLWALEVPNLLLVMSPVSTDDDHFVPMVYGHECPGTDLGNNWINVRPSDSQDAASDAGGYFGAFNFVDSTTETLLVTQHALTDGNVDHGLQSLGHGYCDSGIVNTVDSDIHLSVSGAAVAHIGATSPDGGVFALALPKRTLGSIDDLDGSYIGVLSDHGASPGQRVSAVTVSCAGGLCSGDIVADVSSGTLSGETFGFDLFGTTNDPSIGFITGDIDLAAGNGNLACTVDANVAVTGQRMISCVGQSPSRSYRTVNVILASSD